MAKPGAVILKEGDVFAFALKDGGWGVGVAARVGWNKLLWKVLGYFFDVIYPEFPDLATLVLDRDDAIRVVIFLHEDLSKEGAVVLGRLPGWDRQEWPMPWFAASPTPRENHPSPLCTPPR